MSNIFTKVCKWILFVFLGLSSIDTNAGHILGTDISYSYVSPNTYLVTLRWYRDCQGISSPSTLTACYSSISAGVSNTITLTQNISAGYYLPNFPYWPVMTTTCNGGSATGIEKIVYQGTLILPSTETDWILSFSSFPQNIGIGQNFFYVSTKIDNLNYPTNNSTSFAVDPTFLFCIVQPAWDNLSATDVDGDSLSYHLIPVLDNATQCPHTPFLNPLPPFPPLQSSTPIQIDSTNGSLTFTPTSVGTAMVSARVDEFRSGVLINSTTIEHVFYIVTGCTVTGIDEVSSPEINLHPNPVSENLFLDLKTEETPIYMEATDVSGKISLVQYSITNDKSYELDIQNLSPGIYTLRVITKNTSIVSRFVKL